MCRVVVLYLCTCRYIFFCNPFILTKNKLFFEKKKKKKRILLVFLIKNLEHFFFLSRILLLFLIENLASFSQKRVLLLIFNMKMNVFLISPNTEQCSKLSYSVRNSLTSTWHSRTVVTVISNHGVLSSTTL